MKTRSANLLRVAGLLAAVIMLAVMFACNQGNSGQNATSAAPTAQAAANPSAAPAAAPAQPTAADFTQVQVGMTTQQVAQLLGQPANIKQEHGMTEWQYYAPQGKFELKFQNDQVAVIETH